MSIKNLYNKINKHMGNHAIIYFIIGIITGLILGVLLTKYFGVQIGPMKIWYNGSGTCIGSC